VQTGVVRQAWPLEHARPSRQHGWPVPPHATQVLLDPQAAVKSHPWAWQHGKPGPPHALQTLVAEHTVWLPVQMPPPQHPAPAAPHEPHAPLA
jgi:hypothetical protein